VPATTDADREAVAQAIGLEDAWPVVTEPFTQWVIEDRFGAGRPALETVGAELVADVEPYERMKLRMLNGAHSTLAYLGYLAGHAYVAEVMEDASFTRLIHGLMTEEVMPTLSMPGVDLGAYRDRLLERFANPALKHRTWQIAMDGSQKLPQRLLGTIADRLAAGQGIERLALGVAAWMRYASGTDEKGEPIDVRDPLHERFAAIAAKAGGDPAALVDGYLGIREVFGDRLPADKAFRALLEQHMKSLVGRGAAATVAAIS
jgi:fructuronate reductase